VGIAALSACSIAEESTAPDTGSDSAAIQEDIVTAELGLEAALLANVRLTDDRVTYYLPAMANAMLAHWAAPSAQACVSTTVMKDSDRDGIPSDSKIVFHCGEASPPGATYATLLTGVAYLSDPNDEQPGDGFNLAIASLKREKIVYGRVVSSTTLDGKVSMKVFSPPKLARGLWFDENLAWRDMWTAADGVTYHSWHTADVTGTYIPDAGAAAYPLAAGRLHFEGKNEHGNAGTRSVVWYFTDPMLHWNRRCTVAPANGPGFDRGALQFVDAAGAISRLEFYSCTAWETYPQ
jgi:hypothetical protein